MSRYEQMRPVRLPSGHGTIKAVVVWSEPKSGEDFHYGRVRSEAVLTPRGELLNKTWGEDLAEYIALLAMRTLRYGGVDAESLSRALDTYAERIRIAYHVGTDERVFSDAITLKFWKNQWGQMQYSARTSPSFPTDIFPLAERMGELAVAASEKIDTSPSVPPISPEISPFRVAPYHLPPA